MYINIVNDCVLFELNIVICISYIILHPIYVSITITITITTTITIAITITITITITIATTTTTITITSTIKVRLGGLGGLGRWPALRQPVAGSALCYYYYYW